MVTMVTQKITIVTMLEVIGKKIASNCDSNFFSTSIFLRTFAPSSNSGAKLLY